MGNAKNQIIACLLSLFVNIDASLLAGRAIVPSSPLIDDFLNPLANWATTSSQNTNLSYHIDAGKIRSGKPSLKITYQWSDRNSFYGFLDKDLVVTRDWSGYNAVSLQTFVPQATADLAELSIMLYEEDGSAYIRQQVRRLSQNGWEKTSIPFSEFYLAGEWTADENDRLDPAQIRKVSFGIYQPNSFQDSQFVIYLNDLKAERCPSPGEIPIVSRQNALQRMEPADGQVYHGVFAFNAPLAGWGEIKSDWEQQFDPVSISNFEIASKSSTTVISFFWFLEWEFPYEICQQISQMSKTVHLGVLNGSIRLDPIISGEIDTQLRLWAQAAREFQKPIFLRLFPEMNGNWHTYSEAYDPLQTHGKYISAWRHIFTLFRNEGADNVAFVWAPTAADAGPVSWSEYYPGHSYVDWVGISVYSFLGNGDPFAQIYPIYKKYAASKPVMIAECAGADADNIPDQYSPGKGWYNNPELWINRFFDGLEKSFPRVKAFCWFNVDRERVWPIQESAAKKQAYQQRLELSCYHCLIR